MRRRALLALPLLGACSVLPDRPFQDIRRYPLAPARPAGLPPRRGTGQALLLRSMRAAPGLEQRGVRRLGPDNTIETRPYDEWVAPPADLAEAALRAWLVRSGLFTAVTAPGSRLPAGLVLEAELTRLDTEAGAARAGLSALLLRDGGPGVLAQRNFEAASPVAGAGVGAEAAAMSAALATTFGDVEDWLASRVPISGNSARAGSISERR